MTGLERQEEIIRILATKKKVTVAEMAGRLGVSEVTIRKDLSLLEDMGRLKRQRGGALLASDLELLRPISVRRRENLAAKQAIARVARGLVSEGDTIYLDSGSTTRAMAQLLCDMNLRVVTNSVDIVLELENAPGIALFCLGGCYRRDAGSFSGPMAIEALRNFQIETCFLGTTGFSREGLFSAQSMLESEVKRAALRTARRRVVLVDSSKYGTSAFSVFARPADVHIVISDEGLREADRVADLGFELMIAAHTITVTEESK